MADIRISIDEVAQSAQSLRNFNYLMYEDLQLIRNQMNQLNGTWISNGSEEIQSRFNQFANRFEIERERIEEYAKFLELTASSYESLESTITANASSIQY